jgi:hypothetical protein
MCPLLYDVSAPAYRKSFGFNRKLDTLLSLVIDSNQAARKKKIAGADLLV